MIEVNGALYLKLDPSKADAAWLKSVRDQFESNKLKEQVVGGFLLVDSSSKRK